MRADLHAGNPATLRSVHLDDPVMFTDDGEIPTGPTGLDLLLEDLGDEDRELWNQAQADRENARQARAFGSMGAAAFLEWAADAERAALGISDDVEGDCVPSTGDGGCSGCEHESTCDTPASSRPKSKLTEDVFGW